MRTKRNLIQICLLCVMLLQVPINASAQIYSLLHSFNAASDFTAPLVSGPDGTLYGVSAAGGAANAGTVFKVKPDGTGFSKICNFNGTNGGASPQAGLVLSGNMLYGTTQFGGSLNLGTIFKVSTDGTGFTTIYNFTGQKDGEKSIAQLALSGNTLYGTALGTSGNLLSNAPYGTIFKINTDGSSFTTLHIFTNGVDGNGPAAGLILSGNILFGTASGGGTWGNGTVFKVNTDGSGFGTLHSFTSRPSNTNSDGANPKAGLILSGNTLYGTTSIGGVLDEGTVFAVGTDGTGFTNLHSFGNGEGEEGANPVASLILSGNTLYGTTQVGGTGGTVFAVNTNGTGFSTLHFCDIDRDGAISPLAGLVVVSNVLFGTTSVGGLGGSVFKVNTNGTGFATISGGSDGGEPVAGLVLSGNTLYGTTSLGGGSLGGYTNGFNEGQGTVFKVNIDGSGFTSLYNFSAITSNPETNSDGANPSSQLVLAGDRLYGTAASGGTSGYGTVFAINKDGTSFTNLYSFTDYGDGGAPMAGLILSGNTLYGTASRGGGGGGTIFKINTDGTGFTTLHSFITSDFTDPNSDGSYPVASLVISGSTLYGTTYYGGISGLGTVFKVDTNGMNFTSLYSFTNTDGTFPKASLVLSGNTLYGTTAYGGGYGDGTVFKIDTNGAGFATLHNFTGHNDGDNPAAGLILSGNTLFGVANQGGPGGVVFQINTDGTGFVTLHTFQNGGGWPFGGLVLSNNTLYGTTDISVLATEIGAAGTVFSVELTSVPASIQFTASPTNGAPPMMVQFNSPSTDSDGNPISSWNWNFGDGSNSIAQNPSHTYATNGTFFPSLTATNNNGAVVNGSGPSITASIPTLINGANQTGAIAANTTNAYTFTANADDSIFLRLGTTNFNGELQLYGPSGSLLSTTAGLAFKDVHISGALPSSGIYTVLVNSELSGGTGTYVLRLAQAPEPFVVPTGDEGGALTGAQHYQGKITLGDIDMWSFTVFKGNYVSLELNTTNFNGLFQLYEPGGALLVTSANLTNTDIIISGTLPSSGAYTALVTSQFSGGTGTYGLTVNNLTDGLKLSTPAISGANLMFTGVGGTANAVAVLYSSTNLATPFGLWTPVLTNHLDQFGVFNATNTFNPALQKQGYFRFQLP